MPYDSLLRNPEKKVRSKSDWDSLTTSVIEYAKAVELEPKSGYYRLGLAWMFEQCAPFANKVGALTRLLGPKITAKTCLARAFAEYRLVLFATMDQDARDESYMRVADKPLSVEAGKRWLELAKGMILSADDKKLLPKLENHLKAMEKKPFAITPIIFSLSDSGDFQSLMAPSVTSNFDLLGDGTKQRWQWLSRDAAMLVWLDKPKSIVKSGRQLFGNRTFWMFFQDGYAALRSLDDNSDGWLTTGELTHIVAWNDFNQNGRCESQEIHSLSSLGIDAIRTRSDAFLGVMPLSQSGLHFRNGESRPTYDWIAQPALPQAAF